MDTKKDPFQNLQERMRNALADHSIRAFQELSSSTRDLMLLLSLRDYGG